MYIRWQVIRRVQRTDANKPDNGASTCIVAPERDPTTWTACYLLSLAAIRGCADNLRLRSGMYHVICLDHCIQCEGRAALSLTPTTMAAMHEQRSLYQPIADNSASAASIEGKYVARDHACDQPRENAESRSLPKNALTFDPTVSILPRALNLIAMHRDHITALKLHGIHGRMRRIIDVALPGRNWQHLWMVAAAMTTAAATAIHG